jgi:hypothetical protein
MLLPHVFDPPPAARPPLTVDTIRRNGRRLHVVRDDLLPAGSKQRAVLPLLEGLRVRGFRQFTYASPFAGFAQVALAYGCRELGLSCRIFAERDATQPGRRAHAFTALAAQEGAQITIVEDLASAERAAEAAAAGSSAAMKIPLGFHGKEFGAEFRRALEGACATIEKRLGHFPSRVWLPVGSGTLARAFRAAAPAATELLCVDVRVLPESDPRLTDLAALPSLRLFRAPETFAEKVKRPPPLPSNCHYDAKLWAFIEERGEDGDLWWNVAR